MTNKQAKKPGAQSQEAVRIQAGVQDGKSKDGSNTYNDPISCTT